MKTLREIQDEVALNYECSNYLELLDEYRQGSITMKQLDEFINICSLEIQRQAQLKINKRIEDDYLNDNFDSQSIINDNNLIR